MPLLMTAIEAIQGMETDQTFQGEPTNKTTIMKSIVNLEKHIQIKPLKKRLLTDRTEDDFTLTDFSHLRCSKWSITDQIQHHQQWCDRGQVTLATNR